MSSDTKRKFIDEFLNSSHSKKKTSTQGVPSTAFLDDEDWTAENIQEILGKDFFDDNPYHRSNNHNYNKRSTTSSGYKNNSILNQENKKSHKQSQQQLQNSNNSRNNNNYYKQKQPPQQPQSQQRSQQLSDRRPITNNNNNNNKTNSTNSILNQDANRNTYKQQQPQRQSSILNNNKNNKGPRYSVNHIFTVGSNGMLLNTQELQANTSKLQGNQTNCNDNSNKNNNGQRIINNNKKKSNNNKKNSNSNSEDLMCADDIEALLNSKSSHEEEAHTEWMETYSKKLDKLAAKEGFKNKENEQKVIQVEVFRCELCKLTSENVLDNCVRRGHRISRITAQKRYFECRGCHFRIHTIGSVKLPARACQCGLYNWMATGKWGTSERFSSTYVAPSRQD